MKFNYFIIPIMSITILSINKWLSLMGIEWYRTLSIPEFTPPSWVFDVVWNILFTLTTISLLIVWNTVPRSQLFWCTIFLFAAQFALNLGWTFLFFYKHLIGYALLDDILLTFTVGVILAVCSRISLVASMLLIPYFLWLSFATIINYHIWLLN